MVGSLIILILLAEKLAELAIALVLLRAHIVNAEVQSFPEPLLRAGYCESFLLHEWDGKVVRSHDGHDIGIFQIRDIHQKEAKSIGLDLENERDNATYANYLYKKNGLKPWYGYNEKKDACTNGIKLPSRDSPEWAEVVKRTLKRIE